MISEVQDLNQRKVKACIPDSTDSSKNINHLEEELKHKRMYDYKYIIASMSKIK